MRWRSITVVLFQVILLIAARSPTAAAQAIDRPHHRAVAAICTSDLAYHCGPARQGFLVCLARHWDSLSLPCYRALRVAAAMDGCEPDYRRYCQHVPVGGGRLLACLRGNLDRLSGVCMRALRGPGN